MATPAVKRGRIFNDPIHGPMEFEPLLMKIIDTPEFQRLRRIKQLGGACYVYPGATHTRFEHSLGVCHLAGKFVTHLKEKMKLEKEELGKLKELETSEKQKKEKLIEDPDTPSEGLEKFKEELETSKKQLQKLEKSIKNMPSISETDIMCVKMAGLCHDLGHGPFSHMFEDFAKKANMEWKHEDMSVTIFERIYRGIDDEYLKIIELDEKHKDKDPKDYVIEFVTNLIKGMKKEKLEELQEKKRHFLYQIVANKDSGVDVDKWDYFARDCHYLGLAYDFQWERCMMLARVRNVGASDSSDYQICFRDSDIANIYAMFRTRSTLHQKAYQHSKVKAVEHMMVDSLLCVKETQLRGLRKTLVEILAGKDDAAAVNEYLKLDDSLVESMQKPVDDDADKGEAFKLVERLRHRELYHYVCFAKLAGDVDPKTALQHYKELAKQSNKCLEDYITEEIVKDTDKRKFMCIRVINVKFGSEEDNPLGNLWFHTKNILDPPIQFNEDKCEQIQLGGLMLPRKFHEIEVRLFCKEHSPGIQCTHCSESETSFEEFVKNDPATFGDFSEENKAYLSKSKAKNL